MYYVYMYALRICTFTFMIAFPIAYTFNVSLLMRGKEIVLECML